MSHVREHRLPVMSYIETARDLAKQDGVRMYVNQTAHGTYYVSSSKRNAVYIIHTDGHAEHVR